MRGWQVRVLYGPLYKISVSYDADILFSVHDSNGKGSGNGSFPFGVTEVFRGLEGGSPIERRPEAEYSRPVRSTIITCILDT